MPNYPNGEPRSSDQRYSATTTNQATSILALYNPMMFSDEFRANYSDEEQMHTVRVLVRLQIRNYGKFLGRLEQTGQVQNNPARLSKVRSWMERLTKDSENIERVLQAMLDMMESGQAN